METKVPAKIRHDGRAWTGWILGGLYGKKTAEKLILELKDKLKIEDVLEQAAHGAGAYGEAPEASSDSGMQAEAVQALVALGYGSAESMRAVKKTSAECATVEEILKEALKYLF